MQASKSANERMTLTLKPMGRVSQSPKYGQSVAPQNEPQSNKKFMMGGMGHVWVKILT